MADNFLEKQMDDYRSGRLSQRRRTIASSAERVFIITADPEAAERYVRHYRQLGCRTAFTFPDARRGAALAQDTGAQCHYVHELSPEAIEHSLKYIIRHWGGIDTIIDESGSKAVADLCHG